MVKRDVKPPVIIVIFKNILRHAPDIQSRVVMPEKSVIAKDRQFHERHFRIELESDAFLRSLELFKKIYAFPYLFSNNLRRDECLDPVEPMSMISRANACSAFNLLTRCRRRNPRKGITRTRPAFLAIFDSFLFSHPLRK